MSSDHPSPVIHLDNSRTTRDFLRRTTEPYYNPSDIYLLIQRHTSCEVDKCEHCVQTGHLPDHLQVSVPEVDSRSAPGESELGTGIGQRGGYGFWRRNDSENLWCVGDLEPEDFIVRGAVGL